MDKVYKILIINPGSTSTKIAVYKNHESVYEETLRHSTGELSRYESMEDQYEFRKGLILDLLKEKRTDLTRLSAVIGRGGLLKPIEGGTYLVDENMVEDLRANLFGKHVSNLGGIIAYEIGKGLDIPAFIVDPVVVDELDDIARISGIPQIERISIFHALNQKAVGRKLAKGLGRAYEDLNLIVAHIGGGVTVGAHRKGRVIDVNNGLDGDGPFSPERSGGLPTRQLIRFCYLEEYDQNNIEKLITGQGGLVAYLGTNDARQVAKMIEGGDKKAELIYRAMAYQISKEIGACAAVLGGQVDAIGLTGGVAYDEKFVNWIRKQVEFIAGVFVFPGEAEMEALAEGGLRILRGEEEAKKYQ